MIGLVDGNNFFVSCERVFDPSLEGKPVAVLSNNDGCVISRSYELKALDVPMGTPFFQLRPRIARHGIVVRSSNYELYADLSRRMIAVLHEFAPEVEQYSIDEAFVEIGFREGEDCVEFGRRMRAAILAWVGIPCGVGFAPTKTLAKIANHVGKKTPGGVFAMPADPAPLLDGLPVREVWGIGRRLAPKLEARGIRDALALSLADERALRAEFGINVARTARELRGEPVVDRPEPDPESRSVTSSRSFGRPVTELSELEESVAQHLGEAAARLRAMRLKASAANVFFQRCPDRGALPPDGGFSAATVAFERPCSSTLGLIAAVRPRLKSLFRPGERYRKTGVTLLGLEGDEGAQTDLFADSGRDDRSDRLAEAMDRINGRFGKGTLFSPAEGIAKPWAAKREFLSPCRTTRWDQLLEVR
ncbi:MAG: Y-family DNA polymerase [Fibrobacterales bacterium]|nr:Y-family DNA polymerase [Fibrobacterales bacterium]